MGMGVDFRMGIEFFICKIYDMGTGTACCMCVCVKSPVLHSNMQ